MLTFLRKIRRSLIESSSARKYIVYAIGEIALVVIGILIALQINNWNEFRKQKQNEKTSLIEIREDIKTTLDDIGLDSSLHKSSLDASLEIMKFLNSNHEWQDSMSMLFELAYYDLQISSIESSYRSLESKGIDLISNKELRNLISYFYDHDIPWLRRVETGNGRFNDLLLPYYSEHFKINNDSSIRSVGDIIYRGKSARNIVSRGFIPVEIEALKKDPKFKVLLREVIYERIQIYNAHRIASRNAYRIIKLIDKEVGNPATGNN